MEDFVRFLITPLLEQPDKLEITTEERTVVVKVDDAEVGKIIGKHGSVIHSLRTLVKTYCALHQLPTVNLILNSPEKPLKTD